VNDLIPLHYPALEYQDLFSYANENYQKKIQDYFSTTYGKKNILFTGDGRTALFSCLKNMGVKKDDEIIVPGYGCNTLSKTTKNICTPIFVDIRKETNNIDEDKISESITKKTKAILAVHLYGNPCNIKKIMDIANDKKILVIEDVAQSLHGKYDGKILGSFGDYSFFSFRFSKDITCFRGGALITNDQWQNNNHFESKSESFTRLKLFLLLSAMNLSRYFPSEIYGNLKKEYLIPFFKNDSNKFKMDEKTLFNYQLFLLSVQLNRIDEIIKCRRSNADYYNQKLKDIVSIPVFSDNSMHSYFRYTIQTSRRNQLFNALFKQGVETDTMYDYYLAPLPNAQKASEQNLNIPVHHKLKKSHIQKIVEIIHGY
jgi:dTDP-4-amino-4,6-dideoxygalactose transaminase